MSLLMSFFMSAFVTFLNIGLEGFFAQWLLVAFPNAFWVAFLLALILVPLIKRITNFLIKD